MNIKLIIATPDIEYAEFLSSVILEQKKELFEVSICSSAKSYSGLITRRPCDVLLLDSCLSERLHHFPARLQLILDDERYSEIAEIQCKKIDKYQRISNIISHVLIEYSKVSHGGSTSGTGCRITAVWSPCGGVGKTTVALAYAAKQSLAERKVIYLNFESFSSQSAYFTEPAKSISELFEAVSVGNNAELLIAGLLQKDKSSGILYFGMPQNYDDVNMVSEYDLSVIINGCAVQCDELIIDLPSLCNSSVKQVFELSDCIFAVDDGSGASVCKWNQFKQQNNIFGTIEGKTLMIANKGYRPSNMNGVVNLPLVKSNDAVSVYKTLLVYDYK